MENEGETTLRLAADRQKLTIMGVQFADREDFDIVAYVASTNMIEGWKPTTKDIEDMKSYVQQLREQPEYS